MVWTRPFSHPSVEGMRAPLQSLLEPLAFAQARERRDRCPRLR